MSNRFLNRRFLSIIDSYLKGKSTAEQNDLVDYFYDSIEDEEIPAAKLSSVQEEIKSGIDKRIQEAEEQPKRRSYLYLKVASCLVLLAVSTYFIYRANYFEGQGEEKIVKKEVRDDAPVIVLNNGKSFHVGDSLSGPLAYKVVNGEEVVVLSDEFMNARSESLSQIKNPTNKVFAFLLQDGTTAWLNPNSSLEVLPDTDHKRVVKIRGTVLFDVEKLKRDNNYVPFVVKTNLQTIEVLGTKFIVNATNSATEDVLLLEGKVKLTHNNYQTEVILKPDQKASLQRNEPRILITRSADNYKVEAWHKGLFHFENERMADVMSEIAQWYGKNIVVDASIKNIPITGMISRYKNIDEVLMIIEMTNNVNYRKRGEEIYVK